MYDTVMKMGIRFRIPGSGAKYESSAALFPVGYLYALAEVGARKAKEMLSHARDDVAEWVYVTRNPELRKLRGLAEKAGGSLMAQRDGFVSVKVPYGGRAPESRSLEELTAMKEGTSLSLEDAAKNPGEFTRHVEDMHSVYQKLQKIMEDSGYQLEPVSDGVLKVRPLFFGDVPYHIWGNIMGADKNRSIGTVQVDGLEVVLSTYRQEGGALIPISAFASALRQLRAE